MDSQKEIKENDKNDKSNSSFQKIRSNFILKKIYSIRFLMAEMFIIGLKNNHTENFWTSEYKKNILNRNR